MGRLNTFGGWPGGAAHAGWGGALEQLVDIALRADAKVNGIAKPPPAWQGPKDNPIPILPFSTPSTFAPSIIALYYPHIHRPSSRTAARPAACDGVKVDVGCEIVLWLRVVACAAICWRWPKSDF